MGKVLSVTTAAKAWEWIDKAIEVMRRDGQHRYSTYRFRAALQEVEAPFGSEAIPRRCGISSQDIADRFVGHEGSAVQDVSRDIVTLGPGVTANRGNDFDPAATWDKLVRSYDERKRARDLEVNRSVSIDSKGPICVLVLGDMHFGSPSTNYRKLQWVKEQILRKDIQVFSVFIGDICDQMVWNKVKNEGRASPISAHKEIQIAAWWLNECARDGHMVGGVAGNHDLIGEKLGGVSPFVQAMDTLNIPFGKTELLIDLSINGDSHKWELRHKFPGNSIYNSAHGATRWLLFNHRDSEIACAGHTHESGIVEWTLHGKQRAGIQVGAFKAPGEWEEEEGFKRSSQREDSFGVLLWPGEHRFEVLKTERAIATLESDRRASDGRGRGSATSRVRDAAPVHTRRKTNRRLRRA